jgi:hypothetical protein
MKVKLSAGAWRCTCLNERIYKTAQRLTNAFAKNITSMKKYMVILPMSAMTLFVALPQGASAQTAVLEVIKAGVKKSLKQST